MAYLLSHWAGLTRFLENAVVPLDNDPAERALRGLVMGRKNHYGSRSVRGAETSAILYSLLVTARLCGVEPGSYLRQALIAALGSSGEPIVTLPFNVNP